MEMFQHDSATTFPFALEGDLTGDGVQELEHAWTTAQFNSRDKSADGRNFWNLECVKNCDDHGYVCKYPRYRYSRAGILRCRRESSTLYTANRIRPAFGSNAPEALARCWYLLLACSRHRLTNPFPGGYRRDV